MASRKPVKWSREDLLDKMHQAQVFQEPIVQDFMDKTEESLFEKWRLAKDNQIREEIWLQCQGLLAFRKFLEDTIVLGNMAQSEINKEKERESNLK